MRIRNARKKQNDMKNLLNYFTPRNAEEKNSLIGIGCGILILTVIFYFYSL